MNSLLEKLNGQAIYVRVFYEVVVVCAVIWVFCQVRDFPTVYVTKAEANIQKQELRTDLDRLYNKLDEIEVWLRRERR
jgi:hypothetical protein